jgi:hypothetical protein
MGEMPLIRKTIAFVLTLVALPVLFVGTCVPVWMFADRWSNGPTIMLSVLSFTALFVATALGIAVRTSNPGIRWAIIALLAIAAITIAVWSIQLFMH